MNHTARRIPASRENVDYGSFARKAKNAALFTITKSFAAGALASYFAMELMQSTHSRLYGTDASIIVGVAVGLAVMKVTMPSNWKHYREKLRKGEGIEKDE